MVDAVADTEGTEITMMMTSDIDGIEGTENEQESAAESDTEDIGEVHRKRNTAICRAQTVRVRVTASAQVMRSEVVAVTARRSLGSETESGRGLKKEKVRCLFRPRPLCRRRRAETALKN